MKRIAVLIGSLVVAAGVLGAGGSWAQETAEDEESPSILRTVYGTLAQALA